MPIVVTTGGPVGEAPDPNIFDYTALCAAIAKWAGRENDSDLLSTVPMLVSMTTAMFNHGQQNMVPLRTREMLITTQLTPVNGVVSLPSDFLQFRSVVSNVNPLRDLQYITPGTSNTWYADGTSGLSNSFGITGNQLSVYPISTDAVSLSYYQKIPELSDLYPTNWLLDKQPNVYLHGGLLQLAMYTKDDNLFQRSAALVTSLIDGLMAEELMANYARTGTRLRTPTP